MLGLEMVVLRCHLLAQAFDALAIAEITEGGFGVTRVEALKNLRKGYLSISEDIVLCMRRIRRGFVFP